MIKNNKWERIGSLVLGNAILAFLVAAFVIPHGIITGGGTGIGIVVGRALSIDPAAVVLVFNIAMLILGAYLAQIDLKALFQNREVWKTGLLRMLLIPALSVLLLLLLPLTDTAKLVLMVAVAAPTGISAAMFAQMFDSDYLFATRVVGLTTMLSLFLLPGWIAVLSMLL